MSAFSFSNSKSNSSSASGSKGFSFSANKGGNTSSTKYGFGGNNSGGSTSSTGGFSFSSGSSKGKFYLTFFSLHCSFYHQAPPRFLVECLPQVKAVNKGSPLDNHQVNLLVEDSSVARAVLQCRHLAI